MKFSSAMNMDLLAPFGRAAGIPAYAELDALSAEFQKHCGRYEILRSRLWLGEKLSDFYPGETAESIKAEMQKSLHAQVGLLADPKVKDLMQKVKSSLPLLDEWQQGNYRTFAEGYAQLAYFINDPSRIQQYEDIVADAEHVWNEKFDRYTEHKKALDEAALVRESLLAMDPAQPLPELSPLRPGEAAFEKLAPTLQDLMDMRREYAQETAEAIEALTGQKLKPSEAATMQLNPDVRNEDIDRALAALKDGFPGMIAKIEMRQETHPPDLEPLPEIPEKVQLRIFERMLDSYLESIGTSRTELESKGVRLHDIATTQTGYCWGYPDVQISVETYKENIIKGLCNAFHEFGHLAYLVRLGELPDAVKGRPVAQFNGFGVHETAAMFMEQAGLRERAFELTHPVIIDEIKKAQAAGEMPQNFDFSGLDPKNLHRHANHTDLSSMEWGTSEISLVPNMAVRVQMYRMLNDAEIYGKTGKTFTVADMPRFWADEMKAWTGKDHDPRDFMIGESHPTEGLESYFWAYMTGATAGSVMQDEMARRKAAPDEKAKTLAEYLAPYTRLLDERIFKDGSKIPPMRHLEMAIGKNPFDPAVIMAFKERLAAAAEGLAPDQALARKYAHRPAPAATPAAPPAGA